MEEHVSVQFLRERALEDYSRWCAGSKIDSSDNGDYLAVRAFPPADLLKLLDQLTTETPTDIEYYSIYCACVLRRNFPYLQAGIQSLPSLQPGEFDVLSRFARIFLNTGCYKECIDCCNLCMGLQHEGLLFPEQLVELLFARSKSQRNLGKYQYALDDLRQALYIVEQRQDISYLKGAVLVRIGKVYSQFLMMMSVSLCFLHEAKDQLEPWLNARDEKIREKVNQEYAICLDSIGQYWKGKGDSRKAIYWFEVASKINKRLNRISGIFRTESHIIMTRYPELLDSEDDGELDAMVRGLKFIVRKLEDDYINQRGLAVRQLHLAEVQARRGIMDDALYWLGECSTMARLYRDDKTQIKRKIMELKYGIFKGNLDPDDLRKILELAASRGYYGYEIKLHEAIISVIRRGTLSKSNLLNSLSRSRTLYLQLSNIAQETIEKITGISDRSFPPHSCDEFSCLSEKNSKDLLVKVVHDYDFFIKKMNEIIDQLLQITEQRSKDLNKAILAEAKASLASGVLHDLKHMISVGSGSGTRKDMTCLDDVLDNLNYNCPELPQEKRRQLITPIQTVNQNLKNKIFPRILEATRVPNDFNCEIDVLEIFSEVRQLQMESSCGDSVPVTVKCQERLSIIYNREIFFNLIKEMYRNALDYQRRTQADVVQYIMEAKGQDGEVEIQILTDFRETTCAKQAAEAISCQLREENGREDGFGIRALRGFMQFKTGGACSATVAEYSNMAGIRFSVPRK